MFDSAFCWVKQNYCEPEVKVFGTCHIWSLQSALHNFLISLPTFSLSHHRIHWLWLFAVNLLLPAAFIQHSSLSEPNADVKSWNTLNTHAQWCFPYIICLSVVYSVLSSIHLFIILSFLKHCCQHISCESHLLTLSCSSSVSSCLSHRHPADASAEVRGGPASPLAVQVSDVNKDYVFLTWQPPSADGVSHVEGYYVEKWGRCPNFK